MTVTKYEGSYKCKWPGCNTEFKAVFGKYSVESKRQNGTSAVKCPACKRNCKPITDAITLKEIKEKKGVMQNG